MSAAELIERLRQRAMARLSLKKPSRLDLYDAALDEEAATRIASLEARVAEYSDTLKLIARGAYDLQEARSTARLALKGAQHDRD